MTVQHKISRKGRKTLRRLMKKTDEEFIQEFMVKYSMRRREAKRYLDAFESSKLIRTWMR